MPYGEGYQDQPDTGSSSAKQQSEGTGQSMNFIQGLFGGLVDVFGNAATNNENAYRTAQQREWQDYMSSSAHRRETTDLQAAGLNPILSATGGSGSSTPGGGMIPAQAPSNAASDFDKLASGASARQINKEQQTLLQLQQENTGFDTDLKKSQTSKNNQDYNTGLATQHNYEQATQESKSRQAMIDAQKEGQDLLNIQTRNAMPKSNTEGTIWSSINDATNMAKKFSIWAGDKAGAAIDQGVKDLPKVKEKLWNMWKDTFPGSVPNPSSAKGTKVPSKP